jgi:uncharacterized delta-60 repeat protein
MNIHLIAANLRLVGVSCIEQTTEAENISIAVPLPKRAIGAMSFRRSAAICMAVALLTCAGATTANAQIPGAVDSPFDSGSLVADGNVFAVVPLAGGKVMIGGNQRKGITRVNSDGTFDPSFVVGADVGIGFDGVNSVAVQSDGKVVIGGSFAQPRPRVARLNPNGTLDMSFNPGSGPNNRVHAVALQSDGKVLIGGAFTSYNGAARGALARLNANGTLDSTFEPAVGEVTAIAVQSDGKIIVGGFFTRNIARLNADGSLDTSFNPGTGADSFVTAVAVQNDGKVLIGGGFFHYNGTARNHIARLNGDGTLDMSFNPGSGTGGGNSGGIVSSVTIQSDGKVLIGGDFTDYNGTARNRIARVNANGTVDTSFNPGAGAPDQIYSVSVQSDGKVLIGGSFGTYDGVVRKFLARLNADGTLDTSFVPGTGADNLIHSAVTQTDGKVVIAGRFDSYDRVPRRYIARLNANGALDTSFNPGTGANNVVSSVAVQRDGKLLIGGVFTGYNGAPRNRIARLNADGTVDTSFDPGAGADNWVYSVTVQSDGKIVIAGAFTSYNGTARRGIARLNADGSLDTSFIPPLTNGGVFSVALQSDGKMVIGGTFEPNRVARLNGDGSLDTTFSPNGGATCPFGCTDWVNSVAVQRDGKVLVGGWFGAFNGIARSRIARLNQDGTLDTSFNPGTGVGGTTSTLHYLDSMAVQSDGRVLIGGVFVSYNGTPRKNIARLNPNGTPDSSFDPGTSADHDVMSVAVRNDGKVLVAGDFVRFHNSARAFVTLLDNGPASEALSASSPNRIEWLRGGNGPEVEQVTFEVSEDGGASWTSLGSAVRIPGGWEKTGLSLPGAGTIRAQGRTTGGWHNGSSAIVASTAVFGSNPALQLASAVSRKTHGSIGTQDVPLPLSGAVGVESRTGGGAHMFVFTFSNSIVSANAAVTSGSAAVAGSPLISGNTIAVNLTNVADAQTVIVTLNGVTDSFGQTLPSTAVSAAFLHGDTNGDRTVNSGDALQTRNRSGQTTDPTNFRSDVNGDGTVNSGDAIAVRSRSGNFLP